MTTAYPLAPANFPRAKAREKGKFSSSLSAALKNVQNAIRLFAQDSGKPLQRVVLSSNVTLGTERPADPGVAVYFVWDGLEVCIPVDRYLTVEANLQVLHHIIEARRVELRHGTLALVHASFAGFKALPVPKSWRDVFGWQNGTPSPLSAAVVEARYRELARSRHPDTSGSEALMTELNAAREAARKELR